MYKIITGKLNQIQLIKTSGNLKSFDLFCVGIEICKSVPKLFKNIHLC